MVETLGVPEIMDLLGTEDGMMEYLRTTSNEN